MRKKQLKILGRTTSRTSTKDAPLEAAGAPMPTPSSSPCTQRLPSRLSLLRIGSNRLATICGSSRLNKSNAWARGPCEAMGNKLAPMLRRSALFLFFIFFFGGGGGVGREGAQRSRKRGAKVEKQSGLRKWSGNVENNDAEMKENLKNALMHIHLTTHAKQAQTLKGLAV